MTNVTVGIHQPNFIPWMGFFSKIYRSDVFVLIDDVQYVTGSVCNRTKIKNNIGQAVWLTVPVKLDNGSLSTFRETRIADPKWFHKALNLIKASYVKAPYFASYFPDIERQLSMPYESLAAMNVSLIKFFCDIFSIGTPIYRQSETGVEFGKKNELNLGITLHFNGTVYLSGNGARKYNDPELFEKNGILLRYVDYTAPSYKQINGPFIEGLSVLDVLFNEGADASRHVKA